MYGPDTLPWGAYHPNHSPGIPLTFTHPYGIPLNGYNYPQFWAPFPQQQTNMPPHMTKQAIYAHEEIVLQQEITKECINIKEEIIVPHQQQQQLQEQHIQQQLHQHQLHKQQLQQLQQQYQQTSTTKVTRSRCTNLCADWCNRNMSPVHDQLYNNRQQLNNNCQHNYQQPDPQHNIDMKRCDSSDSGTSQALGTTGPSPSRQCNLYPSPLHHVSAPGHHAPIRVAVTSEPLKRWLKSHRSRPYPSRRDKQHLSDDSGMDFTGVTAWFATARRMMRRGEFGFDDEHHRSLPSFVAEPRRITPIKADEEEAVVSTTTEEVPKLLMAGCGAEHVLTADEDRPMPILVPELVHPALVSSAPKQTTMRTDEDEDEDDDDGDLSPCEWLRPLIIDINPRDSEDDVVSDTMSTENSDVMGYAERCDAISEVSGVPRTDDQSARSNEKQSRCKKPKSRIIERFNLDSEQSGPSGHVSNRSGHVSNCDVSEDPDETSSIATTDDSTSGYGEGDHSNDGSEPDSFYESELHFLELSAVNALLAMSSLRTRPHNTPDLIG